VESLQRIKMKSLRNYLEESDYAASNPVAGDTFAINIREECLIESVVIESRSDGVVIAADDRMIQLLESYGYTFEQTCMECGGSGCGCGQAPEEYGDDADAGQNPGEYDQEGDMAKDELMTMIRSARRLIGMLDNNDNMPEWTQKKITKSADYVDTAADYIASQKERGVMEQGVAEGAKEDMSKEVKAMSTGTCPHCQGPVKKKEYPTLTQYHCAKCGIRASQDKPGVTEGDSEPNPVARAVLHRIMMQHTGLLGQYGPERVMAAVDELADRVNIGPDDEIGSSDVSAYVREVERALSEQGMAEGDIDEAEYQGRKVQLGKPMQGDVAKSKVYVKDPKTGNVKKVNFGDPNMSIKKSNPARRKSFRARHNCDNPGPRTKARYWSCRAW
jgi:hypothetical protein